MAAILILSKGSIDPPRPTVSLQEIEAFDTTLLYSSYQAVTKPNHSSYQPVTTSKYSSIYCTSDERNADAVSTPKTAKAPLLLGASMPVDDIAPSRLAVRGQLGLNS